MSLFVYYMMVSGHCSRIYATFSCTVPTQYMPDQQLAMQGRHYPWNSDLMYNVYIWKKTGRMLFILHLQSTILQKVRKY